LRPPGCVLSRDSRASIAGFRLPDTPRLRPVRSWPSEPSPRSRASDPGDAASEGLCLRDRAFLEGPSKICGSAARFPLGVDGPATGVPKPPFFLPTPTPACAYCPSAKFTRRALSSSGLHPATGPSRTPRVLEDRAEAESPGPLLVCTGGPATVSTAPAAKPPADRSRRRAFRRPLAAHQCRLPCRRHYYRSSPRWRPQIGISASDPGVFSGPTASAHPRRSPDGDTANELASVSMSIFLTDVTPRAIPVPATGDMRRTGGKPLLRKNLRRRRQRANICCGPPGVRRPEKYSRWEEESSGCAAMGRDADPCQISGRLYRNPTTLD
jgi:hypothetical protein